MPLLFSLSHQAISEMSKAVVIQDNFGYIEPPIWPWSSRLCLGQYLMDEGRYADAEMVFKQVRGREW